jgi:nitrate reductase assembly molybdenum cofactor insertion protein NarJ
MDESLLVRARCFATASTTTEYPDEETRETLLILDGLMQGSEALCDIFRAARDDLRGLQARYTFIFDLPKDRVPLYETEHGRMRGMSKGNDLADIGGFYRAFGVEIDDASSHEMLDHLAVELEFYALMLVKEHALLEAGAHDGADIVREGRRKFLESHLGRFVAAIAGHPRVDSDSVYGPVLSWIAELVNEECDALGVMPAPLEFFPDVADVEDSTCGAVKLPVLN